MYTYIPLLLGLRPISLPSRLSRSSTEHQAELPVLYSSFPLANHFTHIVYICQSQSPHSSHPLFPNCVHMSIVPLTTLPFQGPSLCPHTGKLCPRSYHIISLLALSLTSSERPSWTILTTVAQASQYSLPFFLLSHSRTQYCMQFFACLACPTPLWQDVTITREGTYSLGPHSLQHPEENPVLRDT